MRIAKWFFRRNGINATFEFKMSLWTKSIPAESTSKFDPDYAFAMRRSKKIFWKRTSSLFKKKSFEFQHMQFSDQRPLLLLRLYKKSFMFRKNAILVFVSWYDVVQYMNYTREFTFTWKFVDFCEIGEITKL